MQIIKDYDRYIYEILPNDNWDGTYRPIDSYKSAELLSLLGPQFASFQIIVMNSSDHIKQCNLNIDIAKAKGQYDGKTVDEWKKEREDRLLNLRTIFSETLNEVGEVFKI